MKMVGKNPTDFATTIEISPAVLSSIKSGRTKPTLFLVERIKSVYPNININWLITGEGEMFTDGEQQKEQIITNEQNKTNVQPETKQPVQPIVNNKEKTNDNNEAVDTFNEPEIAMRVENKQPQKKEEWEVKTVIKPDDRKISQIIVLYSDGTFETLTK